MTSVSEALEDALGAWASKLCAMPNIRERERYDAASAILRAALAGNALDEAHMRINSLGGYVAPEDERGQGFNEAIGKALAEIEALGGSDPAIKAAKA